MKRQFLNFVLMSVFLVFTLASCGGGAPEGDAVQTVVAATFEALMAASPEADSPSDAGSTVAFDGISFSLDPMLASNITYELLPPPDPASDNPFQTPSYYQFDFEDFIVAPGADFRGWRNPRLYIIPVANMRSFPDGGYGLPHMARLQEILETRPDEIAERMPVLPYWIIFDNGEVFHSNVEYLDFQNGSGVRFLAEYSQAAFPVGQLMSYIFQGLTDDGNYYVSLTLPISLDVLEPYNAPYNASISDEASYQEFVLNYSAYLLGAVAILETTPDSSFTPDLVKLDAFVQSLIVEP